jgi:hypothetical protein
VSSYVSSFVAYLFCPTWWQQEMYCSVIVHLPFPTIAGLLSLTAAAAAIPYPQCLASKEVMRMTVLVSIGVVW